MKKIAYLSIAALLGSATLVSCNDFLDTDNKSNATNTDNFYSENLDAAQANAYYYLKNLSNTFEISCWGTDLYIPVRSKDPGDLDRFATTAENSEVADYYKNNYSLIQYACLYAEKAGAGSKGEAEGHFLRDLAYYNLTQQFGGVPYIDHYVTDASRDYPRVSLDSLYNIVENDLETIYNENVLDATNHNGYASNQAVAALLAKVYLADGWDCNTTLTDAQNGTYSVNNTAKFQQAAQWAEKAIGSSSVPALTQTFEQKWSPSNEGNAEQIFSIQYDRAGYPGNVAANGHGLQNQFGNYYGDPTKTGLKYSASTGQLSAKALRLWNRGDERWDATFMNTIYNWNGKDWPNSGYYAYYSDADKSTLPIAYRYYPWYMTQSEITADLNAHKSQYVKGSNVNTPLAFVLDDQNGAEYTFNASGTATRTAMSYATMQNLVYGGNTVKKFDDPTTSQVNSSTQDYRDVVVLDLSDIYLVAAEAYYMAGNEAQALKYINAVRSRAGAETLNSFADYNSMVNYSRPVSFGSVRPIDCILDERARELYGQEMRYVDLRRTKQLVRYNLAFNTGYVSSVSEMEGPDGNIKWYRPIPQEAINNNPSLTQNPGY